MAKKAAKEGVNRSEAARKYVAAHPTASPTEIVEGLKAEGVEVSLSLASKIKYDRSRKGGGKMGRKKKAATAKAVPKAGGERGEKAEAIRAAARSIGGKVRPRDVIAMLAEQGIKVSSAQVSTTLRKMGMRKTKRGRKPGRPAASARAAHSGSISIDDLIAAKKLVEQLGSIEAASQALSALAKLT
jgi:arginine repressor